MSKLFITTMLFFWLNALQSQIIELKELKEERERKLSLIKELETSVKALNQEIAFIEESIIGDLKKEEWIVIYSFTELLEYPNIFSKTIFRFKSETRGLLLDAKKDFLKVKTANGVGFVKTSYTKTHEGKLKDNMPLTHIKKNNSSLNNTKSSYTKSRSYIRRPRGGCYYINKNGNKTYVDRSKC